MDGEALPEEGALKLRLKYKLKKASGGKGRAELVGGGGAGEPPPPQLKLQPEGLQSLQGPMALSRVLDHQVGPGSCLPP